MKVYVAEKPSLGKAIADVLAERDPIVSRSREHIEGKSWIVCWAAGHLFSLEDPDFYTRKKFPDVQPGANGKIRWCMEHLPIIPSADEWSMKLSKETSGLFAAIKRQVARATTIVHAGDPDRAGQAIIDNILSHLKVKVPVYRVLISSFVPQDVRDQLAKEQDNRQFANLGNSEHCRSRADWLYGMNFSRAVTLKAQEGGYRGAVSIGRVQTAVLSLVVRRDEAIENFKPVNYFDLVGKFMATAGGFTAKWHPSANTPGLDSDGRLLDQAVAQGLQQKVRGQQGVVVDYVDERKVESAPLPFSLAQLQMLAGKKYGYKPDQVLATVQSLYETHKAVSYPRVDTGYLPVSMLSSAKTILDNVTGALRLSPQAVSLIDPSKKSRAFNDAKVTAHHGIVPTTARVNMAGWSQAEKDIYAEIATRFVAQFLPGREYRAVKAVLDVVGEKFVTTGSTTISPGWRLLYSSEEIDKDDDEGIALPPLAKGDSVRCDGLDVLSKQTQPPKPFTDASLLEAMVHIHKYVTNPDIKSIFQKLQKEATNVEEAGLGTPATRQTFVPKLIDIGLLSESKGKGKQMIITSTPAGRALVHSLPGTLGSPDVTALWELTLHDIAEGKATVDAFMGMQARYVSKTLTEIQQSEIVLPSSPGPASRATSSSRSGARAPATKANSSSDSKTCPDCGKPMKLRPGKRGDWWGCSGYPACKHTEAA